MVGVPADTGSPQVSPSAVPQVALSVVLATVDRYQRVQRTVAHLEAQTIRSQLEVVLVAPSIESLQLKEDPGGDFYDFKILEVGEIRSLSKVKVQAIEACSADLVVFAEDHSWPEPCWAEAIVEAHQAGYAVVGPRILNANPDSVLSCANYFACFGSWCEASPAGEVSQTPWHNTSYRREHLLQLGSELPKLLEVEVLLQDRLRQQGFHLFLLEKACTYHLNISRLGSWIRQAFWAGKLFAGTRWREKHWGPMRRLIYIFGAPLIPLVRLQRLLPILRQRQAPDPSSLKLYSTLMLSFAIHAVGEACGYAFGVGSASQRYLEFEARRLEALSHRDRSKLESITLLEHHA